MRILMLITGFALLALVVAGAVFIAMNWVPDRSVAELRPRWGAPPSVFLDIDGMPVHVRDEGPRDDPSPIVLLHGFGSSLHAWDGWAEALRDKRRVVRLDLPGFGLTGPSPDGVYGLERDMRVTLAVLDRLGIARCVLGGNSLGGAVSWRMALAHPARVEKMILVDAGGYPQHATSVPIGMRILRVPGTPLADAAHVAAQSRRAGHAQCVRGSEPGDPGDDRALVRAHRPRRQPPRDTRSHPSAHGLDRIRTHSRTHAAHPDHLGRPRPPDSARRRRALSPRHRRQQLVIFDDLGHAPEEEDPVRSVAAVKRFLQIE